MLRGGLSDEQKRKYRILDNKTNEFAEWDMDALMEELEGLDFEGFDFRFDLPEQNETAEVLEDEAPEVNKSEPPITQPGDVWLLGRHRLMCGDSTVITDVEKLMDGRQADLLITDPPYNVDVVGGSHAEPADLRKRSGALTIMNDKMKDNDFRQFLTDALTCADVVMKPGAVFYIWHADSEGYNFRGACRDVGWKVRECLIWVKNSLVMGRQDYQWKHEPCLYGWKEGTHLWASDRKQTTVLNFDRPTKNDLHPTMKPVKLFDYQIQNNTKGGDIVLDLFGGSGTTVAACEQNGRTAYCMELDARYCDVIVKRWEKLTGKQAELAKE